MRDNKRGYLPAAPDELPMVLLDALGTPAPGPDDRPLRLVRLGAVLAAFEAVALSPHSGTDGAATAPAPPLYRPFWSPY